MTTDIDAIVRGLSKAMVEGLKAALPCDDGGARLNCNRLYPPTIRGLEERGLIQFYSMLTPLGLAVRARLLEQETDNG